MDITTIKYPSHNELVQWYYQLAQRVSESTGVTPEQVNVLIETYIEEHPYPVVPPDIITQTNAAANVVTSVNGKKGDVTGVASVNGKSGVVTVNESPENVITTDNIVQNAVTSYNGTKGAVTGVSSVNGISGQNVILGEVDTETATAYVIKVSPNSAIIIANITTQCVSQSPPQYAGVVPKCGYTGVMHIVSAEMAGNPAPFVKNGVGLESGEGVWTIILTGIASGQQVTIGDQKPAWVTLLVVR